MIWGQTPVFKGEWLGGSILLKGFLAEGELLAVIAELPGIQLVGSYVHERMKKGSCRYDYGFSVKFDSNRRFDANAGFILHQQAIYHGLKN